MDMHAERSIQCAQTVKKMLNMCVSIVSGTCTWGRVTKTETMAWVRIHSEMAERQSYKKRIQL